MKVIFHDEQYRHDPKFFIARGRISGHVECPGRIDALLEGCAMVGLNVVQPNDHGMKPIADVHSVDYLTFLKTIYSRWSTIEGSSEEVVPNIHPLSQTGNCPESPVGQAGFYMADTGCPISQSTWDSAYWSAQTAVSAATMLCNGEGLTYALCRPPGHHAFPSLAGGSCYLNNAAIAAQHCVRSGYRVAIIDIDAHHGNGTQRIFYHRSDVLTVSLHADPHHSYPYFWGHSSERGTGAGLGNNLNLPLPLGTGDEGFLDALLVAVERIKNFSPDTLIVSLGLDTFENDPSSVLSVSTQGFREIASVLAKCGIPTTLIQEGGYLCPELKENLASFLDGFLQIHSPPAQPARG